MIGYPFRDHHLAVDGADGLAGALIPEASPHFAPFKKRIACSLRALEGQDEVFEVLLVV